MKYSQIVFILGWVLAVFLSGCKENAQKELPPVAQNDQYEINADKVAILAVLSNDYDPDGRIDPSSVEIASSPQHGSVHVESDGNIRYQAFSEYEGKDSFGYRIKDNSGLLSNEAKVTLTVHASNNPPEAKEDIFYLQTQEEKRLNVLDNDHDTDGTLDTASLDIVTPPLHGTVKIDYATGSVLYMSNVDYEGTDTFFYRIADNDGAYSDTVKVMLHIVLPNRPPVANNDTYTVKEGSKNVFEILSNDTDPDGDLDTSSIVIYVAPSHGTVKVDKEKGNVQYHADDGYGGEDRFFYRVYDAQGTASNEAVVNIVVTKRLREVDTVEPGAERWYIQFSTENLLSKQKFSGMKLGEMRSDTEASVHSLSAFGSTGYPYLDMVCIPSGSDKKYAVYYQSFSGSQTEKHWRFKVRTNDSQADLVLRWQGVYVLTPYIDETGRERYYVSHSLQNPLWSHMKLIDVKTGEEISAIDENGLLRSFRFNMDGETTRDFEWVWISDMAEIHSTVQENSAILKSVRVHKKESNHHFDLHHPPLNKGY